MDSKTGIYKRVTSRADTPEEMHQLLTGIAQRHDLDWQLEQIEPAVLGVLEEHGARIETHSSGFRVVRGIDSKTDDIAHRAKTALHWIDALRRSLGKGDARHAGLAGIQLGYHFEAMGVRPFERFVKRGRDNLGDLATGRAERINKKEQRYALIRAEVRRLQLSNPHNSVTHAMQLAAGNLKCSLSTVERAMGKR